MYTPLAAAAAAASVVLAAELHTHIQTLVSDTDSLYNATVFHFHIVLLATAAQPERHHCCCWLLLLL
jgi:hypothetical protein